MNQPQKPQIPRPQTAAARPSAGVPPVAKMPPNKRKKKKQNTALARFWFVTGIVLCVIFGLTLCCNLYIIIMGTIDPDNPPSVLGVTPMIVLSGSMSGTAEDHIEPGDLIFVNRVDPDDVQIGDIVAYKNAAVVVTHRVVDIVNDENGRHFITKGDTNNAPDINPVYDEQIVGMYQMRIPKIGNLALFMQTPIGMLLFIGVPLLAFIIYDIIRRQRYSNLERRNNAILAAEVVRLRKQMDAEKKDGEN